MNHQLLLVICVYRKLCNSQFSAAFKLGGSNLLAAPIAGLMVQLECSYADIPMDENFANKEGLYIHAGKNNNFCSFNQIEHLIGILQQIIFSVSINFKVK